jgi:hypothetical protein
MIRISHIAIALCLARCSTAFAAGEAPDPRRGERLDGRTAPRDPKRVALAVPRAILAVPRLATRLLLGAATDASFWLEKNGAYAVLRGGADTAAGDTKTWLGFSPDLDWENGRYPLVGLTMRAGPSHVYAATWGDDASRAEAWVTLHHVTALGILEHRADNVFAGIEGNTGNELHAVGRAPSRYAATRAFLDLSGTFGPDWLRATVGGNFDFRDYSDDGGRFGDKGINDVWCLEPGTMCSEPDPVLVPGFDNGLRVFHAHASVRTGFGIPEARRDPHGFAFTLAAIGGRGVSGDTTRDVTWTTDIVGAFTAHDRSLILRARVGMVTTLGGAQLPFDEMLSASGPDGLRALLPGRLRGPTSAIFGAEYRWLLLPYLDAALFVDEGLAAGPNFENISLDRFYLSAGAALHLYHMRRDYWKAAPVASLQVAWSAGELRVLLSF